MDMALALPNDDGSGNIDNLIAMAVQSQASVENLERLLSMRRELKAEYALTQFNNAMAAFQVACPIIVKKTPGARTKTGAIVSRYATLDAIVRQTKQLIATNGFHYTIDTQPGDGGVHVYVHVSHSGGHEKITHVYMPYVERTSTMTNAQVEMATMTIATRRGLCNAFGIITGEEDKDGQYVTPEQVELIDTDMLDTIEDMLIGHESIVPSILKKYKVPGFAELNKVQAVDCINRIQVYLDRVANITPRPDQKGMDDTDPTGRQMKR